MSDDDREKKSWREIDSARNRGVQTPKQVSKMEERAQKVASRSAIKELNALFSGSKISKEKSARLQEIQAERGKPSYYEKLSSYYKDYGLPLAWEEQVLFLDHRDTNLVVEILQTLLKTAPREDLQRQDLLAAKLKVMALSTFDGKIIDAIKALQSALLRS